MVLYADLLFIINFIMNGFILWITAKITRPTSTRKRKKFRIILGGAVMALLYTLLVALEFLRFINTIAASILILIIGLAVTFCPVSLKIFLKTTLIAYVVSFFLGGLGMALFYLTDLPYAIHYIAADLSAFSRAISWQLAITGMVLSYILIKTILFLHERHTLRRQLFCEVRIKLGECEVLFDALVDTGHHLKDPISKSHVIITEFEHIKIFLPDGLRVLFYEKQDPTLGDFSENDSFNARVRLIPFHSIGKKSGMLIGFKPDCVQVTAANHQHTHHDIVIGIYNHPLTQDGRYHGLLSPELYNQAA